MTPAARVAAAIDILGLVDALERPADRVVERWYQSHRFAGAKDRAAINSIVYGVLRHRAKLAWNIARFADEQAVGPRTLVIAELARDSHGSRGGVAAMFDSSRYGPVALDDVENALLASLLNAADDQPDPPDWVQANCPEWLFQEFSRAFGDAAVLELSAMEHRPPLDLRANTLKASPEEALSALSAEGVEAERSPHAPTGLRVCERSSIRDTRAFREGLVEVQDEGSQMASILVDARPGGVVVDLCAGAGGKSLALAASMMNQGVIHACDISQQRLKRMGQRLDRSGATIVNSQWISGVEDPWFDDFVGKADRVLVDAPCTGTGTIRRNPDLPWRLSPNDLERHISLQRQLLARAATLVAPRGRLIYVTCSLLKAENEHRVRELLLAHNEFNPVPIGRIWAGVLDGPVPEGGDFVLLTPKRYGTDGFFIAVVERRE